MTINDVFSVKKGLYCHLKIFVLQKCIDYFGRWVSQPHENITPFRGTITLLCQISPILMNDGFLTKSASMIFVDGRWIDEFNGNNLPIPSLLEYFIS